MADKKIKIRAMWFLGLYTQLLPYTPETAHLVGTRDDY